MARADASAPLRAWPTMWRMRLFSSRDTLDESEDKAMYGQRKKKCTARKPDRK
jgi:hypothetical protein